MGADIHTYVETKRVDGSWSRHAWETDEKYVDGPFDWRSYNHFGWLGNVRNYSEVPPLDAPRGLPEDVSREVRAEHGDDADWHSETWFTADELKAFDYDATFEDVRGSKVTAGNGKVVTYREFLGDSFLRDVEILVGLGEAGCVRVVLWFDN